MAAPQPTTPEAVQARHECIVWLIPLLDQRCTISRSGSASRADECTRPTAGRDDVSAFLRLPVGYGRACSSCGGVDDGYGDTPLTTGEPFGNLNGQSGESVPRITMPRACARRTAKTGTRDEPHQLFHQHVGLPGCPGRPITRMRMSSDLRSRQFMNNAG